MTPLTPEQLVEKTAEADFNRVFPERNGDFRHPLNKDIAEGLLISAREHLRIVLAEIENIAYKEYCPSRDEVIVKLKPEFANFLRGEK